MRHKAVLLLVCLSAFFPCLASAAEPPVPGYVPDEAAAVRLAVSAWQSIYGRRQIARQRPFHATLARGVWTVEGSLPAGALGGVALAKVRQRDGTILRVSHGR